MLEVVIQKLTLLAPAGKKTTELEHATHIMG
jgi:hypothetical protein